MTDADVVLEFARLRWRLIRNILKTDGSQKWAIVLGLGSALLAGAAGGVTLAVAGNTLDDPDPLFVIAPAVVTAFVVIIGLIAGVAQPVDPRVLATEPITDRHLGYGLLTASAVGPPGLAAGLLGLGLFVGAWRGPVAAVTTAAAVVSLLATMLLISRSSINALGLFATRYPRAGQLLIGLTSLIFYGSLQLASQLAESLSEEQTRRDVADAAAWTPPGQLGRAIAAADESIVRSFGHLALGTAWLPLLVWLFVWSTRRLTVSTKRTEAGGATTDERPGGMAAIARRLCGTGAVGAVAWRGLLTRMRNPRTALETFIGAGVGLAVILVPALLRDQPGAGSVLVGGAVQFAVLFMAGNSFGSDGPALSSELLAGVDPEVLVRAKARSVVIIGIPLALVGPTLAAAVTGEWRYLPAGLLVGFGGLFAGTGGAIVQSTLVPIAVPEGDNPLASGDTGKGCLAGVMLAAVLLSLAAITLPVALALFWAVDRGSVPLATVFAVATLAAGVAVCEFGVRYATGRWRRNEPEIYAAVIPAR